MCGVGGTNGCGIGGTSGRSTPALIPPHTSDKGRSDVGGLHNNGWSDVSNIGFTDAPMPVEPVSPLPPMPPPLPPMPLISVPPIPQPLAHREIGQSIVSGTDATTGTDPTSAANATRIGCTDATHIGTTDATAVGASLLPSYPTQTGVTNTGQISLEGLQQALDILGVRPLTPNKVGEA